MCRVTLRDQQTETRLRSEIRRLMTRVKSRHCYAIGLAKKSRVYDARQAHVRGSQMVQREREREEERLSYLADNRIAA